MELKLNKERLLAALTKINKLDDNVIFYSKGGLFIQSRFVDGGEMLNLQLSETELAMDPFGVNGTGLYNIVKSISGDEIGFILEKKNLKISDKDKEYKINISQDVYTPDFKLKISEASSINVDVLLQYIPYVYNVRDKSGVGYDAIFLKENLIVATDSRRLYKVRLPDDIKFIPQIAIDNLQGFFVGEINYYVDNGLFIIFKGNDYYTIRLLEHSIPEYQPLFDGFTNKCIKLNKDFLTVIKNALLVYKKDTAMITLTIKDKNIVVEADSDEIGSFKEKYTGLSGDGSIKIGMNGHYLKDAIDFISKFDDDFFIKYKDPNKAIYLHTNKFEIEILLMPIRITGEEKNED
ncbi:MAG: hypothetical protein PHP92_04145 [Candidatus Nanoarchaeia archaeon]|nr:hypothetical protein [Candidatus Nanoarchaeia archaeon]